MTNLKLGQFVIGVNIIRSKNMDNEIQQRINAAKRAYFAKIKYWAPDFCGEKLKKYFTFAV